MRIGRELDAQEMLQMIFTYLTEISSLRDYDEILEVLANMGRALSGADRCTVWVVDEEKKTIWTKVAHEMGHVELPMGSGIVGHAITTGEKIIIDDAYSDPRFNPEVDKMTGYKTKSIMVIPMFDNEDRIIGAFQAINHLGSRSTFDKRDMQRLMLASTYAAETLNSAKLSEEIQETQKEVVFTMGAIAESRSKETGNHVKRVAEYSKILALAIGMDKEEAELLKQASPMHDIGKIAIPDEILKKPARFTKSERQIMNMHAQLGYEMIRHSERPLLKAAAIVAHEHHEKWDGSGYPRGLKGEEIHIYGRITALADVFDALGSDRVYKKAWPLEKIYDLIREERGKHFDPTLVDAFFENIEKFLEVRERFKDTFQEEKQCPQAKGGTIQILGAYGTRLKGFGTTSIALNEANVIDAGNLLDTLEEFTTKIETIWLTHSHLDHIADIAYILDDYYMQLEHPIRIAARAETIKTLRECFFNEKIWPDFSKIKLANANGYCIEYYPIELGKRYEIGKNETIEAFETDHTVPSCGYIYTQEGSSILITADTYDITNIINIIDQRLDITAAVFECSFPANMQQLAKESKHLTPKLLFSRLEKLERDDVKIYINHIKPMFLKQMITEIETYGEKYDPEIVSDKKFIKF